MNLIKLLHSVELCTKPNRQLESELEKINIRKIAYHSKEISADTLFVCIKGYKTDGHNYAKYAANQGVKVIVIEKYIEDVDVVQLKVPDSREALAVLSSNFFGHPSKSMSVFGVTATNGKTTIAYMTEEIFKEYHLKSGLIGTISVKINEEIEMSKLTTPESYDLHRYFAKMKESEVTHVSMEVSSSALELKRVHKTNFDIVAFINISPEHLNLHESFDAYFDAKASLIRNASETTTAILNIDEPLLVPLEDETNAQVITFGIENKSGTINISNIRFSSTFPSFTVNIQKPFNTLRGRKIESGTFELEVSVPGYHSIYNTLTALIVGLVNDIPLEDVQRGIKNFQGVERRFQILYDKEFKIVDDLLLNQKNVDSCMKTISYLDYKKIHLVHAIRGNNGPLHSKEVAESLAKWFYKMKISTIILTTAVSHAEKKDQVMEEELAVFLKVMKRNNIEPIFFKELEDSLRFGVETLELDDLLIISGAHSMDEGAGMTLELLKEYHPQVDHRKIDHVLKNKLIGVLPPR